MHVSFIFAFLCLSTSSKPNLICLLMFLFIVDKIMVRYGLSKDDLKFVASGESTTYAASDMCEAPATTTGFWDPGYMHDVLLQNLQPAKKYYYSFGSSKVSDIFYIFHEIASLPILLAQARCSTGDISVGGNRI